jgi:hypothetical protein
MPWCPNCHSEYREGFTTCSDCGATLVEDLPEPPAEPREEAKSSSDESLVAVYEAEDELQAVTLKEVLEQAGVPVVEKRFRESLMAGSLALVANMVMRSPVARLYTSPSRADEARQIITDYLAAFQRGELALPDESEESAAKKSKRRKKF